jgi:hypothetical protein
MSEIFRWSFSQWESYDQCPAKWRYQSVLRLPRKPAGPAAKRGTHLHDRAEAYIKGEIDAGNLLIGDPNFKEEDEGFQQATIHPRYLHILDEFRLHPNGDRHTELKLGFDSEWNLVPDNHPQASCIMVLDAVRAGGSWAGSEKGADSGLVRIGEWKSGKPKDSHPEQRKMYALAGFKKWMADVVEVTTFYLEDTAPPAKLEVQASALPRLIEIWDERRRLMVRDEICAPRPGQYCRWCDYAASKGGPCKMG